MKDIICALEKWGVFTPQLKISDFENYINNWKIYIEKNENKIKIAFAIFIINLLQNYPKLYFNNISNTQNNKKFKKILIFQLQYINFYIANNIVKNFIKKQNYMQIFKYYISMQLRRNKNFVFNESKLLISLKSLFMSYLQNYDNITKNEFTIALDKIAEFIIKKIGTKIIKNKKNIEILLSNRNKNNNKNKIIIDNNTNSNYNFNDEYKNYINNIIKVIALNYLFHDLREEYGISDYNIYLDLPEIINNNFENINQLINALYKVFAKYYKGIRINDIIDYIYESIYIIENAKNIDNTIEIEFIELDTFDTIRYENSNKIDIFVIIGKGNYKYKINDIEKNNNKIRDEIILSNNYQINKYSLGDIIKNYIHFNS